MHASLYTQYLHTYSYVYVRLCAVRSAQMPEERTMNEGDEHTSKATIAWLEKMPAAAASAALQYTPSEGAALTIKHLSGRQTGRQIGRDLAAAQLDRPMYTYSYVAGPIYCIYLGSHVQ